MLSAKKKIDDNNYNFKNEVENDETNSEIGEITIVID